MKAELPAPDAEALLSLINAEESAAGLHRIREVTIPHLIGILDSERAQLFEAVDRRFSELNRLAAGPQRQREPGRTLAAVVFTHPK